MNESSNYKNEFNPDEEKVDHYKTVEEFFRCFHLQDIREILWKWLVGALSSDSGTYSTGYARSNLIFVYEQLQSLVEATNEINRRRKKRMKRKFWKQEAGSSTRNHFNQP